MAYPDRRPSTPYSAAFYSEINDEQEPGGHRVFDIFYPNPVLDLARSEFDANPEQTAARMSELAESLLAYPNLPVKMTVNLGGPAATPLDLEDVTATFHQKIVAGHKYHGEVFEAQVQKAQAVVAHFLGSLSTPLESVCSMQQTGKLTDFTIAMKPEVYADIETRRPILNVITAHRLLTAVEAMGFPPQKAPANNY